jgi:cell division protein FtsZ
MKESGVALLGNGRAKGENRIEEAIQKALNSPLLNHNNIHGATGVLVNLLWGTDDFTIREFKHITSALAQATGNCRHIFIGRGQDPELGDEISITVIATGFVANKDRHIAQHQNSTKLQAEITEDYEQPEGEEELLDAPQLPKLEDTISESIEEPEEGDLPLLLNTQIKIAVRREPAYKRGPIVQQNTPLPKEEEQKVISTESQNTKKDSMGRKYVNILQSIFN